MFTNYYFLFIIRFTNPFEPFSWSFNRLFCWTTELNYCIVLSMWNKTGTWKSVSPRDAVSNNRVEFLVDNYCLTCKTRSDLSATRSNPGQVLHTVTLDVEVNSLSYKTTFLEPGAMTIEYVAMQFMQSILAWHTVSVAKKDMAHSIFGSECGEDEHSF